MGAMIQTSPQHIGQPIVPSKPALHVVRLCQGCLEEGDFSTTVVGATDDLQKAQAYVNEHVAAQEALAVKMRLLAPVTAQWVETNPAPYRLPDQEIDAFYGVLGKWSSSMRDVTAQWLQANLTPLEQQIQKMNTPRWSIEPLTWLE